MTAEELQRTFQPFYRAEASRAMLPEGSGLGLAITKAIVDRHQGCLWAHSRPGQGSVYGFCLPQNGEVSGSASRWESGWSSTTRG